MNELQKNEPKESKTILIALAVTLVMALVIGAVWFAASERDAENAESPEPAVIR